MLGKIKAGIFFCSLSFVVFLVITQNIFLLFCLALAAYLIDFIIDF